MSPSTNSHELHRVARTWALDHVGLEDRDGDDPLYDDEGRSHKVKARTSTGRATSFDFRYPLLPFNFLIGVLVNPDGHSIDRAFNAARDSLDRCARPNRDSERFRGSERPRQAQRRRVAHLKGVPATLGLS